MIEKSSAQPQIARARILNHVSGGHAVSSQHHEDVLLAEVSLYVHKGCLKSLSFIPAYEFWCMAGLCRLPSEWRGHCGSSISMLFLWWAPTLCPLVDKTSASEGGCLQVNRRCWRGSPAAGNNRSGMGRDNHLLWLSLSSSSESRKSGIVRFFLFLSFLINTMDLIIFARFYFLRISRGWYCGEPAWPRGSVLGLRPPGLKFRILCLEDSVISIISPSSDLQ